MNQPSQKPAYSDGTIRIVTEIAALIGRGELKFGDTLPNDSKISRTLAVTAIEADTAKKLLAKKGILKINDDDTYRLILVSRDMMEDILIDMQE